MSSAGHSRGKPLPAQTTGDTQYNVPNAALYGASLAFSKPPVKPKPLVNTYTGGGNGALLAATKVGTGTPRAATPSSSPLRRDYTGGSHTGRPAPTPQQLLSKSSSSSTLGVPDEATLDRTPSPSNIAAKLAAARFSPMKPIPHAAAVPILHERDMDKRDVLPPAGSVGGAKAKLSARRQPSEWSASTGAQSVAGATRERMDDKPTDDTPIPPTTSLVKMFEQNRPKTPQQPKAEPVNVARGAPPPVRSPKPQRKIKLPLQEMQTTHELPRAARSPPPAKLPPKPRREITKSDLGPSPNDDFTERRKDSMAAPPVKPKPKLAREVAKSAEESQLKSRSPDGKSAPSSAPAVKPKPKPKIQPESARSAQESTSAEVNEPPLSPIKQKPPQLQAIPASSHPRPPPKRGARSKSQDLTRSASLHKSLSGSIDSKDVSSPVSSYASAPEEQDEEQVAAKLKPSLPPPRRSAKSRDESTGPKSSSVPPKATLHPPGSSTPRYIASPLQAPEKLPPRPYSAMGSSPPESIYHSNYQRESVKAIAKHMTGESLSNAIVGAALASSRNASPAPPATQTPPLPARRHHHHHPFHIDRSPSPQKKATPSKMRTTMRKEPSSSDEEEETERYKRKGTRIMGVGRKHPNKHHEGTRKRWRDAVTDRERKRYEGVWAANKGLFISSSPPMPSKSASPSRTPLTYADEPHLDVLNVVTREIWQRSRLPQHELEEVWDLVDGRGVGRLCREEFVVGMWLIDQRLKGRKLPPRVSDSVWGSVRGVGVKVRSK